jgi:DNA-binding HxlR family transcriptional regulator
MVAQEGTRVELRHTEVTIVDNQQAVVQTKIGEILPPPACCEESCSVRSILDRVSDKWFMLSMLILGQHSKLRFNELKKHIGTISQRMLTVTLRNLEEDGLVKRTIYAEVPPRVEYELTALGSGLLIQFILLGDWIKNHKEDIIAAREKYNL